MKIIQGLLFCRKMFSERKTKTSSLAAAAHTQPNNGETAESCHRVLMTVHIRNPCRQGKGRKGQDGRKTLTEEQERGVTTKKTQTL